MPLLLLLLWSSMLYTPPQSDAGRLVNTTWKVTEVNDWYNMERMYTGLTLRFTTDRNVTAIADGAQTEGKYALHPNPPDLEIVFSRQLKTMYEAKDEFNIEYPNDTVMILKPFFRGGQGYIRMVRVK